MRLRSALAIMLTTATSVAVFSAAPVSAGNGATQVAGQTDSTPCDTPPPGFEDSQTADGYAFHISGDLTGCIYGVITDARFHPAGTYQEIADEIFVSDANSGDTFEMTELYTAKFNPDFSLDFARCKHPIVSGSGNGAFEGVSGRLDFKDDVDTGIAYYKGHLKGI